MNSLHLCWYMVLEMMGAIVGKLNVVASDRPYLVPPDGLPQSAAIIIILRWLGQADIYHEHLLLVFSAVFTETLLRQVPGLVEDPHHFIGIVFLLYLATALTYLIKYEPIDWEYLNNFIRE